jgi:NMD protein affecting ribosome stability and mRNA decay
VGKSIVFLSLVTSDYRYLYLALRSFCRMDFCVRCGDKGKLKEFLCKDCYDHVNKPKIAKVKEKKEAAGRHADYFEATIQLRNVGKGVHDYVAFQLEGHEVSVAKEEWLKNGVDLFISDLRFAKKLGTMLQKRFGGMVKESSTLFTRDKTTSKEVHRVTVLFKQFPFKTGEAFKFKGEKYLVVSVRKDVIARNSEGRSRRFKFKELEKARVF